MKISTSKVVITVDAELPSLESVYTLEYEVYGSGDIIVRAGFTPVINNSANSRDLGCRWV